jgi:hypothetical protein
LLASDVVENGHLATDVAVWLRLPDGESAAARYEGAQSTQEKEENG